MKIPEILLIETEHRPGSLAGVLQVVGESGLLVENLNAVRRDQDRTVWELVAYIKSISEKPGPTFGKTTSVVPQSPDTQQVPAGKMQTATPWKFTEPMPKQGKKS